MNNAVMNILQNVQEINFSIVEITGKLLSRFVKPETSITKIFQRHKFHSTDHRNAVQKYCTNAVVMFDMI